MQFLSLRLTGFKSFVDPTELLIEPGITGVVGPNGCGKSNLVEALRWVMGESSARRMRGQEMDDVIFGGTAGRPPRNIAEVALRLDNAGRTAPAPFNGADEIQVSRRIERDGGSDFRINGKPARARDVQILFQDHAAGSGSPALVGQGRVGAIIAAKPAERRAVLEEAAGITGLHSRRHEAELRLRAAEGNLARLDDVLQALQDQLGGLKRQIRQAGRYRALSDQIRRTEAALLLGRWQEAGRRAEAAAAACRWPGRRWRPSRPTWSGPGPRPRAVSSRPAGTWSGSAGWVPTPRPPRPGSTPRRRRSRRPGRPSRRRSRRPGARSRRRAPEPRRSRPR